MMENTATTGRREYRGLVVLNSRLVTSRENVSLQKRGPYVLSIEVAPPHRGIPV